MVAYVNCIYHYDAHSGSRIQNLYGGLNNKDWPDFNYYGAAIRYSNINHSHAVLCCLEIYQTQTSGYLSGVRCESVYILIRTHRKIGSYSDVFKNVYKRIIEDR
jgi:hypothetical protein